MGYPTKVQLIRRKKGSDQYYINFPTALAEAIGLRKGEVIEWDIVDRAHLIAQRRQVPSVPVPLKKTRRLCSTASRNS